MKRVKNAMDYHFCTQCGMFTGTEGGKCLFCGADIDRTTKCSVQEYIMSSLRLLLLNPRQYQKE